MVRRARCFWIVSLSCLLCWLWRVPCLPLPLLRVLPLLSLVVLLILAGRLPAWNPPCTRRISSFCQRRCFDVSRCVWSWPRNPDSSTHGSKVATITLHTHLLRRLGSSPVTMRVPESSLLTPATGGDLLTRAPSGRSGPVDITARRRVILAGTAPSSMVVSLRMRSRTPRRI